MPDPLPLKLIATDVCMRSLLLENVSSDTTQSSQYLTRLLETDCFTAVSEDILHRILKYCPEVLTNRLLHALTPPYIQGLNLSNARTVTLMGLVETLRKCKHVHRINLSCCSQLIHPNVFEFMSLTGMSITTVILEENQNITDEVVHAMLRYLPSMETLNLSTCSNITDHVFLLDEHVQLEREVSFQSMKDDQYKCNLTDIDISGCRKLDTTAVTHLVSLCGPKLKCVNISWTSVNCIGLLHLAGYSRPAILDFILTVDVLKSDKELKQVLQSYREIRETYVELFEKETLEKDEHEVENKPLEDGKKVFANEFDNDATTQGETDKDIIVETDINLDILSPTKSNSNEESDNKNELNDTPETQEGASSSKETKKIDKTPYDSNNQSQARKKVYIRNGEIVGVECVEHGEDCESCDEICDSEDNGNETLEAKSGTKRSIGKVKKCGQKPAASDKLNFDYNVQLYQPKIVSLNICGIQYVSRRPYLGQLCLEKFLEANKGLKKFSVSWKGLTLDFFRKVVHNLTELVDVELEECTMLQSAGIAALGLSCPKLQSLNIRGVVFISNSALVSFLTNKNLVNLQLAESNNITDAILIKISNHFCDSLESIDLSYCEDITEKGINAICSTCTNLKKIWLRKCPVSDFTLRLLSETCHDLVEISVESADTDDTLSDVGVITMANSFRNLLVIDISWNLAVTDLSVSAVMLNCCLLEEANFKGLKLITIDPFLPIISDDKGSDGNEASAGCEVTGNLPFRSTVYAPNLRILDLDYSDLVNDQLLQKIVNVCRGTLHVTDYYGQKLEPE